MKLKGTMTIQLIDVETGQVEQVIETNMLTDAVNNIFQENPMGILLNAAGKYDTLLNWTGTLLPICPNLIGGILLFSKALEEKTSNIYSDSSNLPVAYASNDVNSTENLARGSLNLTESKVLDNGYRFIWEFTPNQGNGTIAAVALTSSYGGKNAYGSLIDDASPFLLMRKVDVSNLGNEKLTDLFLTTSIDFEKNCLYSLQYSDSSVIIRKLRIPTFTIGLNESLNDSSCSLLESQVLACTTFKFLGSYIPYGVFCDGGDGYWYGFSNQQNTSGDAKMLWMKIKKEDYTFTEGSWTLTNCQLPACGSFRVDTYPIRIQRAVVRRGYLYIPAYNKTGIYKINLSNSTDVKFIEFGFTSQMKPLGGAGNCENYLVVVGDLIIGWDFQITANDKVIQTVGTARLDNLATPLFQYKNYLTGWGSSYSNAYHLSYLLTPYLASINNLSSPITKTADKTMKITYELTEVDGTEK
ncbi:hypothetical protein P261_02628 [Lachnospiraceae bacterium TWA4]|nr:hypothetical protein P261_02628 [Lachnospiraceae bacterium TWA4]